MKANELENPVRYDEVMRLVVAAAERNSDIPESGGTGVFILSEMYTGGYAWTIVTRDVNYFFANLEHESLCEFGDTHKTYFNTPEVEGTNNDKKALAIIAGYLL